MRKLQFRKAAVASGILIVLLFAGLLLTQVPELLHPGKGVQAVPASARIAALQEKLVEKVRESKEQQRARSPFTDAAAAHEYYLQKRVQPGTTTIPYRKYREAMEQMTRMERYSTRKQEYVSRFSLQELSRSLRLDGAGESQKELGVLDSWTELGPGNVGGRTRAMRIDPNNADVIYAAGETGGVWKTVDAGANWTPLADLMANLNVSALAIDPSNTSVLYAGTGEGFTSLIRPPQGTPRPDLSKQGAGLFKTTDAGLNWTQIASTVGNPDFQYVNDLIVSPRNSSIVYAATRTGVWRSLDAGATWSVLLQPQSKVTAGQIAVGGCLDLLLRSDQPTDILLAACGTFEQASVYRTADAGAPAPVWGEVLTEVNMGRTTLALAPSSPNVMYALATSLEAGQYFNSMLAVFRSNDGGLTWAATVRNTDAVKLNTLLLSNPLIAFLSQCFGGTDSVFGQGFHDNVIAVDPVNPERVWAGGVDLFRSEDGGRNWRLASFWWMDRTDPRFNHADQMVIQFHPSYNGSTNQVMYVSNDGGVYRTSNAVSGTTTTDPCPANLPPGSLTWQELNNNYGTMQFYHGTVFPNGVQYMGGAQDNGTWRGNDTDGSDLWTEMFGGDGGYSAVDPTNTNILYIETQAGRVQRSDDGGATFASKIGGLGGGTLFIAPFVLDPMIPNRLWLGGRFIFRTDDRADSWGQASTRIPNDTANFTLDNFVSALAIAPGNSDHVLAGSTHGMIFRNDLAGQAGQSTDWAWVQPRPGWVSWLAFDPRDSQVVYATYSSFGPGHVWKSSDGGTNWTNIDGVGANALPDIPVHSVAVDTLDPDRIYVGTDLGVFVTLDGGSNWSVENTGFANVTTESLSVAQTGDAPALYAFTHGRGAFRVPLATFDANLVADPQSVFTDEDTPLEITLTGTSATPGPLTFLIENGPANGSLSAVSPQSEISATVTYTPEPDFNGEDSFTFLVRQGTSVGSPAPVTISVTPVNDAPVADPRTATVPPNLTSQLTLTGSDLDGDSLTFAISIPPANGTVSVVTPVDGVSATVDYTPNTDYVGPDEFTFTATDPAGLSASATVTLSVELPMPLILSLNPTLALVGDPDFTLTVNGRNFFESSVVRWNGSDRPTTFVNSQQLTAAISAADIAVEDTVAITVFTLGGGSSTTKTFPVLMPNPVPVLATMTPDTADWLERPSVTLTGSGFVDNSAVRWNGAQLPLFQVTFVSDTELVVDLNPSQTFNGGIFDVTVFNPFPEGGESAPLSFTVNNPVPELLQLTPAEVPSGSGDTELVLTGQSFNGTSRVLWNGEDIGGGTNLSSTLIVSVPATKLANPGTAEITVVNPSPGGGTSAPMTFSVAGFVMERSPGTPTDRTVTQGQSAAFGFQVASTGTFADPVSFSCQNLPAQTSCAFSPTSLTPVGTPADVALTVATTSPASVVPWHRPAPPSLWPFVLLALSIALGWTLAVRCRVTWVPAGARLVLGTIILLAVMVTGCGGGKRPPSGGTPVGTHLITVNATGGGVTQTLTFTLNVQ